MVDSWSHAHLTWNFPGFLKSNFTLYFEIVDSSWNHLFLLYFFKKALSFWELFQTFKSLLICLLSDKILKVLQMWKCNLDCISLDYLAECIKWIEVEMSEQIWQSSEAIRFTCNCLSWWIYSMCLVTSSNRVWNTANGGAMIGGSTLLLQMLWCIKYQPCCYRCSGGMPPEHL